jgi:hypothetical protein
MQTALVRLNARPAACLPPSYAHRKTFTHPYSTASSLRHDPEAVSRRRLLSRATDLRPRRNEGRDATIRTPRASHSRDGDDLVMGPLYPELGGHGRSAPKHVESGSKWIKKLPIDAKRTWRGARHIDIVPLHNPSKPTSTTPAGQKLHTDPNEVAFIPASERGENSYTKPIGDGPVRKIALQPRPLVRRFVTESPIESSEPRAGKTMDMVKQSTMELPHTRARTEIGIWKVEHDVESMFSMQGYNSKDNEESDEILALLALLQSMARTLGKEGIALAWHQMRGKGLVHIPIVGPAALSIWRIFLMNSQLHEDIFEYAVELRDSTGYVYVSLYESLLGERLATASEDTFLYHRRFKDAYTIPRNALRRLVDRATTSTKSLAIFMDLYSDNYSNSDPIYDAIITRLVGRHMYQDALVWHTKLFTCGDFPSTAVSNSALMDRFQRFRNRIAATSLLEHIPPPQRTTMLDSGATVRRIDGSLQFNRETMYSMLGEKHGIEPKTFTDEFCARLFATKAFSTPLVISSLKMFGIQAIGPLALREMIIKEIDLDKIKRQIKELATAGISIGTSVFSRAVMKLCEDGRADLLRSLLDSDQHPDVLEDTPLQRKLLASYISRDDWSSAHRTLMVLTLFHEDPAQESWNLLLRHYLRQNPTSSRRDAVIQAQQMKKKVQQVVFDMSMANVQVTAESLQSIFRQLLAPRRSGRRPIACPRIGSSLDDLNLVTNTLFQFTSNRQVLPAMYWRELIRRYGMMGRFESMARLCLELARLYSPPSELQLLLYTQKPSTVVLRDPSVADYDIDPRPASTLDVKHPAHPFQQLFGAAAVRALVTWGFQLGTHVLQNHPERKRYHLSLQDRVRDAPWPSHIQPPSLGQTFLRGISLIERLRENGVSVDTGVLKKTIRQRLWQLFSPTLSWRMTNRRAQLLNPYSLEECLQGVLDTWKGPTLFSSLLLSKFEGPASRQDDVLQPALARKFPSSEFEFDCFDTPGFHGKLSDKTAKMHSKHVADPTLADAETHHTILSKLLTNTELTCTQQINYRRAIVRILFGPNPLLGHRRRTEAQRVNPNKWDRIVADWASRGGKGRFRMHVGGLARTKKGEMVIIRKKRVLREGMLRRRNRVAVSGRGSRAIGYLKRDDDMASE